MSEDDGKPVFLMRIWFYACHYDEFFEQMNAHCSWWRYHSTGETFRHYPWCGSEENQQLHYHSQRLSLYGEYRGTDCGYFTCEVVRMNDHKDAIWAKLRFDEVEQVEWYSGSL